MSRFHRLTSGVTDYEADRYMAIYTAMHGAWQAFKSITYPRPLPETLVLTGKGNVNNPAEVAERMAHLVWEANGKYCRVFLDAEYPDDNKERFEFVEADYEEWKERRNR